MAPDTAPFDAFRWAHERSREVVWMSQNTNHLFPAHIVQAAILEATVAKRFQGYPYAPGLDEIKELIKSDFGLPDTKVGITSGGTEALYMLTRALLSPGDEVVASDPSYMIIHRFVELCGAKTINLDIYQPPWRLAPDRVREAITPRTRMILLIDPLNPLGSGYPEADVKAIAEIARDKKLILLNDVTYRDFADHHTLAHTYYPEGTVTVWSVSKNCGLAGLRLGGLIANPELLTKIWRYNTNDLGVNILAQVAALAALRAKAEVLPAILKQTRENQKTIRKVVEATPGASLPVYPSQGNMFVIDISDLKVDPEALQKELLLNHKVFLRAGNYLSPRFGSRFIRASFSNEPSDLAAFESAFPKAVKACLPSM